MGDSGFVPLSIHPLFLSQLSPSVDLAIAAFLIVTGVTSVLGNGTVLLVCCRKKKKRRPSELMTINLAVCDFGFTILGAPVFIISSLCHAWVFGETGCLLYGIQGFVFGIGSLLTTCLISLDRCLKICCLRYGQWIEKRHLSLSIALVWLYTLSWALLPAFGFGSYGPEPYGTSCTINWWRMRSSLNDRIYIFLIMILCFGFPSFVMITSYLAILRTVYRSNRTLASIPSSSVSHTGKDLRLAKMAAVMCSSFMLAWMPYAAVSLISALLPSDDGEAEGSFQSVVQEAVASSSTNAPKTSDIPSLLNWTTTEYYRHMFHQENKSSEEDSGTMLRSTQRVASSLPPVVTLIPVLFAKSHCMMNPLIYQIMNRKFRDDVYLMLFGQESADRRRLQRRKDSLYERSISLYTSQSWRRKSSSAMKKNETPKTQKNSGISSGADSWVDGWVGREGETDRQTDQ